MADPFGVEKGTSIRMPSTANFMIASYDKTQALGTTAGRFGITASQSLLNGFFTRLGVTELAINWNVPNVVTGTNDIIIVDISGVGLQTFTLPQGCYTCADILNTFATLFNSQSGGGRTIAITSSGAIVTITMTGGVFRFPAANNDLIGNLQFNLGGAYAASQTGETNSITGIAPSEVIQPYIYLDFTSPQLTYNQLLKDSATDPYDRDVLCRWYLDYTNDANQVDQYGYAIRMGMKPFYVRREFNPPKQIRWSGQQPVGQVTFEVYAAYLDPNNPGQILNTLLTSLDYQWLMTIQVSEV